MNHEAELQTAIRDALNATGWVRMFKSPVGSRRNVRLGLGEGSPDLVGWMRRGPHRGAFVGLEVKRPAPDGAALTPAQVAWGEALEADGGRWRVVTSVQSAVALVRQWAYVDDHSGGILAQVMTMSNVTQRGGLK